MWGGGIGVTREGKEHVGGRERKISERQREMLKGKKQFGKVKKTERKKTKKGAETSGGS